MAFKRPHLKEHYDTLVSQFALECNQGNPLPTTSFYRFLAGILAGYLDGLHAFVEWVSRQPFIDTCDAEFVEKIAASKKIMRGDKLPASGEVTFTSQTHGLVIPIKTRLVREDGTLFRTMRECTIANSSATTECECETPGTIGNTPKGTQLNLFASLIGIDNPVEVTGDIRGGQEQEANSSLIARYLLEVRKEPEGGNEDDFRRWTSEVEGVAKCWVKGIKNDPTIPAGEVHVYYVQANDNSIVLPGEAHRKKVEEHLRKAPIHAQVFVLSPQKKEIKLELNLKLKPDIELKEVEPDVKKRLEELFFDEVEPGATLYLSKIIQIVMENSLVLGCTVNTGDITCKQNEIFVLKELQCKQL